MNDNNEPGDSFRFNHSFIFPPRVRILDPFFIFFLDLILPEFIIYNLKP